MFEEKIEGIKKKEKIEKVEGIMPVAEVKKELEKITRPKAFPLNKITDAQKEKYLQDAGRTTILREIARNLKRIKRNLDVILLIMTIMFAVVTGMLLGYKEYIISTIPALVTLILAIITYTLPPGDLKDAVDNFENTIIKR